MDKIWNEDAAIRKSFAGEIYQIGVAEAKKAVLNALPKHYCDLHINGYIHIHDLEAYGKVYNCSTPVTLNYFAHKDFSKLSDYGKITSIFNGYKSIIMNLAMCQSGGIGFANFDTEISTLFVENGVSFTANNESFFYECVKDFVEWINSTRTRYCREPYYLSFNIGLDISKWGRSATNGLLSVFKDSPLSWVRPNIIFKVNHNINFNNDAPNHDLFILALECTAKRMIPTYLLTDSSSNMLCYPEKIGIMGCRTRVYQNCNGEETTIGRGNLAYTSINLPRIALENSNIEDYYNKLYSIMVDVSAILEARAKALLNCGSDYFDFIKENKLWANGGDINELLTQGTLSIGFIGLSETVEIITGKKFYKDEQAYDMALAIVNFMRDFVDNLRNRKKLNFSLLATPGEMISGRFCELDKIKFSHKVNKKNFYTNSFHIDVDAGIPLLEKIDKEAPFHKLCNGGCITYIEFRSAPLTNTLALLDAIQYAEEKGISYLGFNYPLDICNICGINGTFDVCPKCGSDDIKRIRRISGYLEDLNYFTQGKNAEAKIRKANA
ncbi:MAG: DUF3029 family protein [Spirochaetaceae bacterium]|jgi:ribonucleoside-triphosphate reductase|nr:DUF3029 family protein [Spirochaetaceae bacterium]